MSDFVIENGVLTKYTGPDGIVVIPDGVTVIGEGVFKDRTNIVGVELNEGLTEVRDYAFCYTGIEKVNIPDSLISIGEMAFVCRKKGQYEWENNDGYAELKLSKKHKVYHTDGKSLLKYNDDGTDTLVLCFKKGLTAYVVPSSVSVIASNAFYYCSRLKDVSLPDSLVTLQDDAFNQTKVAELRIPATVAYLGNNPIRRYETAQYGRVESVKTVVHENNPHFFIEKGCLYERCSDGSLTLVHCEELKKKKITVIDGTTVIGSCAFECAAAETIELPDSVQVIEAGAFYNSKLNEIALPEGVAAIREDAFKNCSKLKSLRLPASLQEVAYTIANDSCNITLDAENNALKMIDGILYDANLTTVKLVTYEAQKKASVILPDTVTALGTAFAGKKLKKLVLGAGVEEIPEGAFDLSRIPDIELPPTVKKIAQNGFSRFDVMRMEGDPDKYTIRLTVTAGSDAEQYVIRGIQDSDNLLRLRYKEDENAPELQDWSYMLRDGEAVILKYFGAAKHIEIPKKINGAVVTAIGYAAFGESSRAKSIAIPETVKELGREAFVYCDQIESFELPADLEKIGPGAFGCCRSLKSIVIPDGVTQIAEEAFYGCEALGSITLPGSVSLIDERWLSSTAEDCWMKPHLRKWKETRTATPLKVYADKGTYAEEFLTYYVNDYQKSGKIVSNISLLLRIGETDEGDVPSEGADIPQDLLDAYFSYAEVEENDVRFHGAIPGTMKITEIKSPDSNGVVTIPEKLNGKDVSYYGGFSYYGPPIKKLVIPKTLVGQVSTEYFPETEELVIDPENPVWSTDGISLLSKDGTALLRMCQKTRAEYTIPEGVTKICCYAFKWNEIVSLTIPDTVTTVESGAFSYCRTLTTVIGGRGIVDYSSSSFGDTPWYNNSERLILGNTLLRWDSADSTVVIPEGIEIIGENAFGKACSAVMETVVLPQSLKKIGDRVFSHKKMLKTVNFPDGLRSIGASAFHGAEALTEVILPDSVEEIGTEAFARCRSLKTVRIPCAVRGAKSNGFLSTISENVLSAGCFSGCTALETIVIPEGIEVIGASAFNDCSQLTDIHLPDSLISIESEAFSECVKLESITLPKKLSSLGTGVFPHGTTGWGAKPAKFNEIVVDAENETYASIDGILCSKDQKTLIACPSQFAVSEYAIPEGITEIVPGAFEGCDNVHKIVVPSTVVTIGEKAFARMAALEEVVFSSSIECLEKSLFEECAALKRVVWPGNLCEIGEKCFFRAGIENLDIPETVKTVGAYAFAYIKAKTVVLPKSVQQIGLSVFAGVPEIQVYDTMDPEAKPAEQYLDDTNGMCNSSVGFIGIQQREGYVPGACNANWHEHTIVVRSSLDDSVKYTVRMPDGQKRKVYCTYASSWGRNAEFNFCAIDAIFKDLTANAKLDYTLERLRYREGMTEETLDMLVRYISRNAKDIMAKIVATDSVCDIVLLEPYGIVKKNTFSERLDQADSVGAVACKAWLLEWQHNNQA